MSDEDRIEKTSELKAMEEEIQDLQNSVEVQGQEKMNKFTQLSEVNYSSYIQIVSLSILLKNYPRTCLLVSCPNTQKTLLE